MPKTSSKLPVNQDSADAYVAAVLKRLGKQRREEIAKARTTAGVDLGMGCIATKGREMTMRFSILQNSISNTRVFYTTRRVFEQSAVAMSCYSEIIARCQKECSPSVAA